MTNILSKETTSFLCYPGKYFLVALISLFNLTANTSFFQEYWNKSPGEWGVNDWDMYYVKKYLKRTNVSLIIHLELSWKFFLHYYRKKNSSISAQVDWSNDLKLSSTLLAYLHKLHPRARWPRPSDFVTEGNRFACLKWGMCRWHVWFMTFCLQR